MKTVLRARAHHIVGEATVFEIWHDGVFLGTVVGADGPGVRVVSKYLTNSHDAIRIVCVEPPVLEVRLEP